MKSEMEFVWTTPIEVEESVEGKVISGVLIREGTSKNGNLYTIESLKAIAKTAINKPIYYGTNLRNLHKRGNSIGQIISTTIDRIKRRVLFKARIFNKKIAESVSKGWGISIGGKADASLVLFGKRFLTKIKSIVINHVQLMNPFTKRGQDEAQVLDVEESFAFVDNEGDLLTRDEISAIISALERTGEL